VSSPGAPLYRQLADHLRDEIRTGRFGVGAPLPTELELCRAHEVSRHTVRDALRVLREEGLIARRRGAGTTVAASAAPTAFVQPLGGFDELLHYARDARFEVQRASQRIIDDELAKVLRQPTGSLWITLEGVRRSHARALAATTIYLHPDFQDLASELRAWTGAATQLIALRTGVTAARIEQEISAVAVSKADARALDARPGEPALRTLRRYFDAAGRLLLASDNRHPGDRFIYAMDYRRDG
jgi:GntR family transcriptional regulator